MQVALAPHISLHNEARTRNQREKSGLKNKKGIHKCSRHPCDDILKINGEGASRTQNGRRLSLWQVQPMAGPAFNSNPNPCPNPKLKGFIDFRQTDNEQI